MNENRLADYLDHMLLAATDACAFVEGLQYADFSEDKRTQQAVIMSLRDAEIANVPLLAALSGALRRYKSLVEQS